MGHNLGGEHPFYDEELVKIGQTGGIMDYGLYANGGPSPQDMATNHARTYRLSGVGRSDAVWHFQSFAHMPRAGGSVPVLDVCVCLRLILSEQRIL